MIRNTRSTSYLFGAQLKKVNRRYNRRDFNTGVSLFEDGNVGNVKNIYERWLSDPNNVGPAWDSFFKTISQGERLKSNNPPPFSVNHHELDRKRKHHDLKCEFELFGQKQNEVRDLQKVLLVHRLIRSYQSRGHHFAKLEPSEHHHIERLSMFRTGKDALYKRYTDEHLNLLRKIKYSLNMDEVYPLPASTCIGGEDTALRLSEIIARLERAYCGAVGLEYTHINGSAQRDYLRKQFELPIVYKLSRDEKRLLLARLARASCFEEFLNRYYPQTLLKYSLEGYEVLIPCINAIIDRCTNFGVDHFIFGIAHRGRMNVLSNVFRVPLIEIMSLFNQIESDELAFADDVSHLGTDKVMLNKIYNRNVRLTLLATPSRSENVNALVLGRTKIEQMMRQKGNKVMPVLVHSDTSFSDQAISYEIVNLSAAPAYNTYGTIHFILNNHAGLGTDIQTTTSRTSSTDLGKIINAPIFHVNASDPEAARHVSRVAANWRNTYRTDCIIELVGGKRQGSVTMDDPMITNPAIYNNKIEQISNVYEKYVERLLNEDIVTAKEALSKYSTGLRMEKETSLMNSAGGGKGDDKPGDENKKREQSGRKDVDVIRELLKEVEMHEEAKQERRRKLKKLREMKRMLRLKKAEKLIQTKKSKNKKS